NAADTMPHVRSDGTAGADIGDARSAAPYQVAVSHLGEHSRHTCAMHLVYRAIQFGGITWVLHNVPRSGGVFLVPRLRRLSLFLLFSVGGRQHCTDQSQYGRTRKVSAGWVIRSHQVPPP